MAPRKQRPTTRSRGDDLLLAILSGHGGAVDDLLGELHAGYPAQALRRLLQSADQNAAEAGAWLASELGARAHPLVDDLGALVRHGSRAARFFAIDAILAAATAAEGAQIAQAVSALHDPDEAIRWKAVGFLARATPAQLAASRPFLEPVLAHHIAWLEAASHLGPAETAIRLASDDHVARLVAAAAAARACTMNRTLLELAKASRDSVIAQFAAEELQALERADARRSRS